MLSIGIDVGIAGGLALLGDTVASTVEMPIIPGTPSKVKGKRGSPSKLDGQAIRAWLLSSIELFEVPTAGALDRAIRNTVICIEKQQAMPKQGLVSTFHLGESYGILQGIAMGLQIPIMLIGPKQWKKVVLANTQMDKTAAIDYVRNRYPTIDLDVGKRKEIFHDGMADAVCIADYGRRMQMSGKPVGETEDV